MTDVLLQHEPDGGNIELVNGVITLTDGLEVLVYLSLFGGNERDSGLDETKHLQWWGNLGEPASRRYRSRTQHLLRSIPLVPYNLQRLHGAVLQDLAPIKDAGIATGVGATVSIPAPNTVGLAARLQVDNEVLAYSFTYLARERAEAA